MRRLAGPSHVTGVVCVRCGRRAARGVDGPCRSCGPDGVVDVEYDLVRVRRRLTQRALAARPRDVWRYRELLPLPARARVAPTAPGGTPLVEAAPLRGYAGITRLLVKDESRNPTGSFKDRSSGVGVARALARRARVVACASTGNAASSLAGAAASVGLRAVIFMPASAAEGKLVQVLAFGARVVRVDADYDTTWDLCQEACRRYGWYNRNSAVNPSLVEGKKTCGLELAEQLGRDVPDWIAVGVGDGCTISAIWKGLVTARALGWIPRLPRLLGVQAEGARPLVEAFREGGDVTPLQARTFADGIAVGYPRNWRKALRAVRDSGGAFVAVSDAALADAIGAAGRAGLFGEPAAVAGVAGLRRARQDGVVSRRASAVAVLTGAGLKDPAAGRSGFARPLDVPAAPDLDRLAADLQLTPSA